MTSELDQIVTREVSGSNAGRKPRALLVTSPLWTKWGGGLRSICLYRAINEVCETAVLSVRTGLAREEARCSGSQAVPLERLRDVRMREDEFPAETRMAPGFLPRATAAVRRVLGDPIDHWLPKRTLVSAYTAAIASAEYDLVFFRSLELAAWSGALGSDLPTVVDLDDLPTSIAHWGRPTTGDLKSRLYNLRSGRRLEHVRRLLGRVDFGLTVSEADQRRVGDWVATKVFPNTCYTADGELPADLSDTTSEGGVLIVGAWDYRANVQALTWFLEQVWPLLRAENNSATVNVVGRGASDLVRELVDRTPGTHFIGEVEEIGDSYKKAAVCVVPTRAGGGSHVKLIEALSHGRCVVATTFGARGFEAAAQGRGLVIADSPSDFAAACSRLLRESESRRAANREARTYAEAYGSHRGLVRVVSETTRAALAAPKGRRITQADAGGAR